MIYPRKTRKAPWVTAKKVLKPFRRVSPVSKKMAALRRQYLALRRRYLKANSLCHVCIRLGNTPADATQVHHQHGRRNGNLLNVSTFLAVCPPCHDRIHRVLPELPGLSGPDWARNKGFLSASFVK